MDRTDVLIFRALFQGDLSVPLSMDPRKSFRAIARNLRIDELTVRNRLWKLHRAGFLKGWRLLASPALLGLKMVQLFVDVRSSQRGDVIEKLRVLPGIAAIVEHVGSSMYVIFGCQDEESLDRQIRLIRRLAGAKSSACLSVRFPSCNLRLSQTDAQIIRALTRDPWKMYTAVAKEVGLSSKTVKRRLDRLIEGKAVFMIPSMDPSALEGAMLADLLVGYSGPEGTAAVKQRILSELDDCLIRAEIADPNYGLFNLILTKVSAVREIPKRVRSFAVVASARIDIVQDRLEMYDQFFDQLEGLQRSSRHLS